MKRLFYLLALVLILASCDQVIFPEAQPKKVKAMSDIPSELHGVYLDENGDSLIIYSRYYTYNDEEFDHSENIYLSDSAVLKEYHDRYFLSNRTIIDSQYYFVTFIIESLDDGKTLEVYAMDPDDVVKLAKLQEITSKVMDIEGPVIDHYLFDPKKKNYKQIIDDTIFTKVITFKKIVY